MMMPFQQLLAEKKQHSNLRMFYMGGTRLAGKVFVGTDEEFEDQVEDLNDWGCEVPSVLRDKARDQIDAAIEEDNYAKRIEAENVLEFLYDE